MNAVKHRKLYQIIYYQLIQRHIFAITGFIRVIPDFLVIGAKRCGTTSLYQHLSEHPCISRSPRDNIGFFNENYHLGINWYKSLFPTVFYKKKMESKNKHCLFFDVTSTYMEEELTAKNVYEVNPNQKIIVILRNPVDRAYSHYHVSVKEKSEKRSFEDAVFEEMNRIKSERIIQNKNKNLRVFTPNNIHYLKKGFYALQLKSWFKIFPREQILVLSTEEFQEDQNLIYKKIFDFLNIPNMKIKSTEKMEKGNYTHMKHDTRNLLLDYFRQCNHELFELINSEFDWKK